jgi:hypothetical protein
MASYSLKIVLWQFVAKLRVLRFMFNHFFLMLFTARDSFCWRAKLVSDTVDLRFIYPLKRQIKPGKKSQQHFQSVCCVRREWSVDANWQLLLSVGNQTELLFLWGQWHFKYWSVLGEGSYDNPEVNIFSKTNLNVSSKRVIIGYSYRGIKCLEYSLTTFN